MPLLPFSTTRLLLEKYSLPLVPTICTSSASQLYSSFAQAKKPVVIKASGPGVMHKTENGLVFLGVRTKEQVEEAVKDIYANAGKGVEFLMQEQLSGAELIIGGKRDPSFGPVVLFGTGGIYAELIEDVSVRVAPLQEKDALEMIYDTRASKFVEGFRGKKMDAKTIASLLVKTGELMQNEKEVAELDFNPVIASQEGAFIVDARVIVEK